MAGGTTNAIISSGGTIVDANGVKYKPVMELGGYRVTHYPFGNMQIGGFGSKTPDYDRRNRMIFFENQYMYHINLDFKGISRRDKTDQSVITNATITGNTIQSIHNGGSYIYVVGTGGASNYVFRINKSDLSVSLTSPNWSSNFGIYSSTYDGSNIFVFGYNNTASQYQIKKVDLTTLMDISTSPALSATDSSVGIFTSHASDSYVRIQGNGDGKVYCYNKSNLTYYSNINVSYTSRGYYWYTSSGIYIGFGSVLGFMPFNSVSYTTTNITSTSDLIFMPNGDRYISGVKQASLNGETASNRCVFYMIPKNGFTNDFNRYIPVWEQEFNNIANGWLIQNFDDPTKILLYYITSSGNVHEIELLYTPAGLRIVT